MKRKLIVIGSVLGILLLLVGTFMVLGSLKQKPEKIAQEDRPVSVFIEEARADALNLTVKTQGEVTPKTEINLVPQVQGKVAFISNTFVEGGNFEKGDTLIQIEKADYELAVIRARSSVAQANQVYLREKAESAIARRDWEELGEGDASALTLREPQLAEAQARLAAAEADLSIAQLHLERTTIKAPFSGRVRMKNADIGQFLSPGQTIGQIFSTDKVEVRLPLTDTEVGTLQLNLAYGAIGNDLGPEVDFSAVVAGKIRHWKGNIVRTDSVIDPRTRVLYAIAEVQDPYGNGADNGMPLAVGLFVNAEITSQEIRKGIVMPRVALHGSDTVYVVSAEGNLEIRSVAIVYSDPEQLIVSDGVEEGDMVVVSLLSNPRTGMKINPLYANGEPAIEVVEEPETEATSIDPTIAKAGGSQ